jgi:hypothetical protein
MDFILRDPVKSRGTRVDQSGRVRTKPGSRRLSAEVSLIEKEAYAASTEGTVSLNTSESGVLYIKNTSSTRQLVIESVRVSSDGAGIAKTYIGNDVEGTLQDNGTAVIPRNLNTSGANNFPGSSTKSDAAGRTISGGQVVSQARIAANAPFNLLDVSGTIVLGENGELAISFQGDSGTPAVGCTIIAYLIELDD